jgi:hypothetical protein
VTATSLAVLGLLLVTMVYMYFTLTTWASAHRGEHVDRDVLKGWRITAFTAMGVFQILVTAALVLLAVQQGDFGPLMAGGYAPAILGIAMISLPRIARTFDQQLTLQGVARDSNHRD